MSSYKKVAIIGCAGQLGTDVVQAVREAGHCAIPLSHGDVEVTNPDSIRQVMEEHRPQVVVNSAAFHQVDACEDDPETAFRVNALGALHVARGCAEVGARCIFISTSYVFGGKKEGPYFEEDTPRPINVYGASKLAGEYLVQQACPHSLIVRVASLFGKVGARGKGGNFVETILNKASAGEELRVVSDSRTSPTYTWDASRALEQLISLGATGFVHLANQGSCTWYEFSCKVLDLVGFSNRVEPISTADYPSRARIPNNSSITSREPDGSTARRMRPWVEALRAYLDQKGYI